MSLTQDVEQAYFARDIERLRQLTRQVEAERAALRRSVKEAWHTGTSDFRKHYDSQLLAVIGVQTFQELM